MGMSEHDHFRVRISGQQSLRGRHAELMPVNDHEPGPFELQVNLFGDPGSDLEIVGVSVDRRNRRQRFELGQEIERADIAGVEDSIDIPKQVEDSRSEETVSIGDQP